MLCLTSATHEKATPYFEWVTSLLITATFGCAVVTFAFVMLLYHFLAGVLFPIFAGLLMKLAHLALVKHRKGQDDPHYMAIQWAVIIGGLLAVLVACLVTRQVPLSVLGYAGAGMALLALISIALEQSRVYSEKKTANRAMFDAESAKRLAEEGQYSNVEETLQEALLSSELAYGSYHPQVATIVTYLAEVMRAQNRMDAATVLYKRAVGIHAASRQSSENLVTALHRLAEHLRRKGDLEESLSVATRAVAESKRLSTSGETGRCQLLLSRIQASLGKTKEAYDTSRSAASTLEKTLGKSDPNTLQAKGLVANHCISLGRLAEGERVLLEVLSEKERLGADKDAEYLNLLLDLSAVQKSGRVESALATLQKAVEIFRSEVGTKYERAAELIERLPGYLARTQTLEFEALYSAIFAGDNGVARRTLEANTHLVNAVDASGWSPLQWAAFFGRHEIVEILLNHGADQTYGEGVGLPAVFVASRWGQKRVLVSLFQKEAKVEMETSDGSRPLHGAVRSGDQLTFDMLMSRNVKLDVANQHGWTPLHEAAFVGERKFLLQLISKGVDLNFRAPTKQQTPLHAAILGGHWSTVETLVLNMADVNAPDVDGVSPIQLAERLKRKDILELLKAHSEGQDESTDTLADSGKQTVTTQTVADTVEQQETELDNSPEVVTDFDVDNF